MQSKEGGLALYLLGAPRVEIDGERIHFGRKKALALLAYLAITQQPQQRDHLLALFWPDYDSKSARTNMRRDLAYLRKQIGVEFIRSDRAQVELILSANLSVDVHILQSTVSQTSAEALFPLAGAVDLYTGDLLAGFHLPNVPQFDDWLYFERERLRSTLATALQTLIATYEQQTNFPTAIDFARRRLALDQLEEASHRDLMRLNALAGQQTAALQQYETCRNLLKDELGVDVSPATIELVESIRAGQIGAEPTKQTEVVRSVPTATSKPVPHNLPSQPTPFIGRTDELAQLETLLADPNNRLVTIVGPGGMGKSRLSIALAEQLLTTARYPNGIYFVALAPLSDPEHIVTALAEALEFPLDASGQQQRTPKRQVLDYLAKKRMMLVLDNFEHLLDGVDLVADILAAAPDVQLLATSRERLRLHQEQIYPIQGLEFPDWETPEDAARYTAVRIFIQSAQRVAHGFELRADDLTYLTRICRLVGGMPLAIELAAGWADMLSLADIAKEIQNSLDFLETEMRNMPARHRSMRAVFEASWARMNSAERALFPKLSVFRGGFDRAAVETIANGALRTLGRLSNKSLIQYDRRRDRYVLHELVRQYGEELLQGQSDVRRAVERAHSDYYLEALAHWGELLKGAEQIKTLAKIEIEIDNIRIAWRTATERQIPTNLLGAIDGLGYFCQWTGRFEYCYDLLVRSFQMSETLANFETLQLRLAGWLLACSLAIGNRENINRWLAEGEALTKSIDEESAAVAFFLLQQGLAILLKQSAADAEPILNRCLELSWRRSDSWMIAEALERISLTLLTDYRYQHQARLDALLTEALSYRTTLGDSRGTAYVLERLSNAARYDGKFDAAVRYAEQCLNACRELGGSASLAIGLESLGTAYYHVARFGESADLLSQALMIREELNDAGRDSTHHRLAIALVGLGRFEEAIDHQEQALALVRRAGRSVGYHTAALGAFTLTGGMDDAAAIAHFTTALGAIRAENNLFTLSVTLGYLGVATFRTGDNKESRRFIHEALRELKKGCSFNTAILVLPTALPLLADDGNWQLATMIDVYCRSVYPRYDRSLEFKSLFGFEREQMCEQLTSAEFESAAQAGRALTLEAGLDLLLEHAERMYWSRRRHATNLI